MIAKDADGNRAIAHYYLELTGHAIYKIAKGDNSATRCSISILKMVSNPGNGNLDIM